MKSLTDKSVLVVVADVTLRTQMTEFLFGQGARVTDLAEEKSIAGKLKSENFDCLIIDLSLAGSKEVCFINQLGEAEAQLPIVVLADPEEICHISRALRSGINEVVLKPLMDFSQLQESLLHALYPQPAPPEAMEQLIFSQDWQELRATPEKVRALLKKLQPPFMQQLAYCAFSYRHLATEETGLILDLGELSPNELAFYCLDTSHTESDGLFAALLLRAQFSHIITGYKDNSQEPLYYITQKLRKVNAMLQQALLAGPLPLLFGYYNSKTEELSLLSAGLNVSLVLAEEPGIVLSKGTPLGILQGVYPTWLSKHARQWQCKISNKGEHMQLSLSSVFEAVKVLS